MLHSPVRPLRSVARPLVTVTALAAVTGLAVGATTLAGAAALGTPSAHGRTIVAVEGDAANGFSVYRLDGTSEHPPTRSESLAECQEYDDPTDVAVCAAEVRTELEWIAEVQRSLDWAAGPRTETRADAR